jgi:hypothetical protein
MTAPVTPITPDFAARFEALVVREMQMRPLVRRLRWMGWAIIVSLGIALGLLVALDSRRGASVMLTLTLLLGWRWITLSQRELREGFALLRERNKLLREMLDYAEGRVPEQPPGELQPGDKFKGPPAGSI